MCGGPPCQDFSIAGPKTGLSGDRSSCALEMIRIVKEMRECGKGPRWVVFENVCGILSTGDGDDFRRIVEGFCKAKDETVHVPRPENGKWTTVGAVLGDDFSLAWRVRDASGWGVPQKRRRVALVVDYEGLDAPKILFEQCAGSTTGRDRICATRDVPEACASDEGRVFESVAKRGGKSWSVRFRSGADIDSSGRSAGKGPLVQTECMATLSLENNQMLVIKMPDGCVARYPIAEECERVQALPTGWTDVGVWYDECGRVRKSGKTNRIAVIGNSIAVPAWIDILRDIAERCGDDSRTMGSLFDGVGGFPLIWECLCGGEAAWASEIDPFCITITKARFGDDVDEWLRCERKKYRKSRHSRHRAIRCVETDVVFECIDDACNEYGINQNALSNCLRGRAKTSGGYHWEYADGKGFEYGGWKSGVDKD